MRYNSNITLSGIPLAAYDYILSGKSALAWVMDRQSVREAKAMKSKREVSDIKDNDPNDYANETMNNPAYPLELFLRVITLSLETLAIVNSLPALDIAPP